MLGPPLTMRCGRSHCHLVTVSREQRASVILTAANILREIEIFLETVLVEEDAGCTHGSLYESLTAFYSDDNLRSSGNKNWNEEEISCQRSVKFHRMTYVTHCNQLWVDAQVFPISTAHISQHTARRK